MSVHQSASTNVRTANVAKAVLRSLCNSTELFAWNTAERYDYEFFRLNSHDRAFFNITYRSEDLYTHRPMLSVRNHRYAAVIAPKLHVKQCAGGFTFALRHEDLIALAERLEGAGMHLPEWLHELQPGLYQMVWAQSGVETKKLYTFCEDGQKVQNLDDNEFLYHHSLLGDLYTPIRLESDGAEEAPETYFTDYQKQVSAWQRGQGETSRPPRRKQ